jgi:hypothetical protein
MSTGQHPKRREPDYQASEKKLLEVEGVAHPVYGYALEPFDHLIARAPRGWHRPEETRRDGRVVRVSALIEDARMHAARFAGRPFWIIEVDVERSGERGFVLHGGRFLRPNGTVCTEQEVTKQARSAIQKEGWRLTGPLVVILTAEYTPPEPPIMTGRMTLAEFNATLPAGAPALSTRMAPSPGLFGVRAVIDEWSGFLGTVCSASVGSYTAVPIWTSVPHDGYHHGIDGNLGTFDVEAEAVEALLDNAVNPWTPKQRHKHGGRAPSDPFPASILGCDPELYESFLRSGGTIDWDR